MKDALERLLASRDASTFGDLPAGVLRIVVFEPRRRRWLVLPDESYEIGYSAADVGVAWAVRNSLTATLGCPPSELLRTREDDPPRLGMTVIGEGDDPALWVAGGVTLAIPALDLDAGERFAVTRDNTLAAIEPATEEHGPLELLLDASRSGVHELLGAVDALAALGYSAQAVAGAAGGALAASLLAAGFPAGEAHDVADDLVPPERKPAGGFRPKRSSDLTAGTDKRPKLVDPPRSAYGLLTCPEAAAVGEPFELTVGLSATQSPGVAGGPLTRPASSVGPYALDIRVEVEGLELADPDESWSQSLHVTAEDPHPTASLALIPAAQDMEVRGTKVEATYSVGGQTIGLAVRYLRVFQDAARVPGRGMRDAAGVGVDLVVPSAESAPDLTVRIRIWGLAQKLRWRFESPHDVVLDEPEDRGIGEHPQSFAAQLVRDMNVAEGKEGLEEYLLGVGRTVADQVPDALWTALERVAERTGGPPTVLLLSEEPYVPWELAAMPRPLDPSLPPYLGAQAIVGRWVLADRQPPPPAPPVGVDVAGIAVISGNYESNPRWRRLKEAEEEAAELVERYRARPVDATVGAVLRCLRGEPDADVLHFAVHGKYDPQGIEQGLAMVDGMLRPLQIRGSTLTRAPFVFLNACQVGSGDEILGDYAGMAAAFLHAGASAVVAPLWSVKDGAARSIALTLYERALDRGDRPAELLMRERQAFARSDGTSATCLAYQFFGHPDMRLSR